MDRDTTVTTEDVDAGMAASSENRGEQDLARSPQDGLDAAQQQVAALSVIKKIEDRLDQIEELESVPGITAGRIFASLKMAMIREPKLRDCTVESVFDSMMRAVSWGLDPTGNMNSAWFIPFWNKDIQQNECVLMPGWGGLASMVIRRGNVASIRPGLVLDCDTFEFEEGTSPFIRHKRGKRTNESILTYAYAVAHFRDPAVPPQFEVIDAVEMAAIENASRGGDGFSPWKGAFSGEMWKKSAVKRLCKNLPGDAVIGEAVHAAHQYDGLERPRFTPSEMKASRTGSAAGMLDTEEPDSPQDG